MTTFRITRHAVEPSRAAVEVIDKDGNIVAVVYAKSDQHLRVVSKYIDRVDIDRRFPPVANIMLTKS